MLVIAHLLSGIAAILDMLVSLFLFLIIARAILSWVNPDPYNPIVRFIVQSTDPLLIPARRYIPAFGGIDFSPIVVLALLTFLQVFLVALLKDYAVELRFSHMGAIVTPR